LGAIIDRNFHPSALARALRSPLPAAAAHRQAAPQLAYGRHRGPVPLETRPAAVLIALCPSPVGWRIPLVLRPVALPHHGGQIGLPGGRMEAGETPEQAALREFQEELQPLGAPPEILGRLSEVYVFASGHRVFPLVAWYEQMPTFDPDPREVARLLWLELTPLCDPAAWQTRRIARTISAVPLAAAIEYAAPGIEIEDHLVWGATAMILSELRAVVDRLR
jgi:8-oxo-dGTP pyrophosphatase MutT (NUDIX family)